MLKWPAYWHFIEIYSSVLSIPASNIRNHVSNSKETCVAVENYLTSALSLIDGIISLSK